MRADLLWAFARMAIFFIAMALLESAVVVYLRALYYPHGFAFPIVPMDPVVVSTEVGREIATLVMLLVPGMLLAHGRLERFAWFCFGFGMWDIFYYVWLKVILDWPASLAEPDLLFLVPLPWVGPVWCPCLISGGLIALAVIVLRARAVRPDAQVPLIGWCLLYAGAAVMITSFIAEPWRTLREAGAPWGDVLFRTDRSLALLSTFQPEAFPLVLFITGAGISAVGLLWTAVRMR